MQAIQDRKRKRAGGEAGEEQQAKQQGEPNGLEKRPSSSDAPSAAGAQDKNGFVRQYGQRKGKPDPISGTAAPIADDVLSLLVRKKAKAA